jgi:YD repeat-containing protein
VSPRLAAVTFPNGQRSSFSYFPNQKDQLLQQITHLKADSSVLSRFTYDYDAVRQVTHLTQERAGAAPLQWRFEYNASDRLTNAVATQSGATVESYAYAYDLAGNRTEERTLNSATRWYYNSLNQPLSITDGSSAQATNEWDADGRLVAVVQGTRRSEFSYDGLGRRIRTVERENGNIISERTFVWCGFTLCE